MLLDLVTSKDNSIILKEDGSNHFIKKNSSRDTKMSDIKFVLGSTSSTSGSSGSSTKNIWVSGLSSNTKAADLKNLFGKYGKVRCFYLFIFLVSPFERNYIQNNII